VGRNSKWRVRAALLAIALAAYADTFGLGLAQDSKAVVRQDTRIREVSAANLHLILARNYWWPKSGDGLYRPVTTLSLLFNYAVLGNGPNPAGYHVVNFLLHGVNVWLVYELALVVFRRAGPAFFAAALWAVHPIGTEAVTSIVGRADLLAAMAVLGGLLLYIRRRGPWATAALFAVATAGVFAKENAAVLLGLMLVWDLSFGEGKSAVLRRWPAYAAVASSLLVLWSVRHVVLGSLPMAQPVYVDNPLRGASFLIARWTALKVIGLDLWLLVCPLGLSCDRSFAQIPPAGWSDPWAWLAFLVIAAILAAALARYRRDRLPFWLAGFFAIALLPTANLVFPIGAVMAERFLYLPAVAFSMAAVALVYHLKSERRAVAALVVLLVLCAGRTLARNPDWNDDLTLASSDVQSAPRSFRLHDLLAKALFEQDAQRNIDRVIQEEGKSWEILAPLPPARSSELPPTFLGIYYTTKADLVGAAESRQWYEKALALLLRAREISLATEQAYEETQRARNKPPLGRTAFQQLYLNLANVYLHLGRYAEALEALRFGRGIDPRTPETYDGLRMAYTAMGDTAEATVALLERAQADGFQPATVAAIREAYEKIPDGSCAFVQQATAWQLNLGCLRVKSDLCRAAAEMAGAYNEARQPERGQELRTAAAQRYGCPAGR